MLHGQLCLNRPIWAPFHEASKFKWIKCKRQFNKMSSQKISKITSRKVSEKLFKAIKICYVTIHLPYKILTIYVMLCRYWVAMVNGKSLVATALTRKICYLLLKGLRWFSLRANWTFSWHQTLARMFVISPLREVFSKDHAKSTRVILIPPWS